MLSRMDEQRSCVIVILGDQLAKGGAWPITRLVSNGKCYRDCGFGEFTEFYDWLRDSDDELLGVRYNLCEDTEFLFDYAQRRDYMLSKEAGHWKYLEIYFSEKWDVDPLRSSDQGFVYDPVFRSDDNEIAIAFDMGWLGKSERQSLERRTSIWAEARVCEPES